MTDRMISVALPVPEDEELIGVFLLRRTPRGTLTASGMPVIGHDMPGQTPDVLRWLADAYELSMLAVTDADE